jgi:hypothetical protein
MQFLIMLSMEKILLSISGCLQLYLSITCKPSNAWTKVVEGKNNFTSLSIFDYTPLNSLGISLLFMNIHIYTYIYYIISVTFGMKYKCMSKNLNYEPKFNSNDLAKNSN